MNANLKIKELKKRGDIKGLIKMFGDRNERNRDDAVNALCEMGGTNLVPLLLQALKEKSTILPATKALVRIDSEAFTRIWLEKDWSHPYDVYKVLDTLAKLGNEGVEPIAHALKHEHWLARRTAVESLGKTKSSQAVPYLIEALKYEDDESVLSQIHKIVGRFQSARTSGKGRCPFCGTKLKFWDAKEVRCYFCGVNLKVERNQLKENVSTNVADFPQEKVIIYMRPHVYFPERSVILPNCCCLCLSPATDHHKMKNGAGLEIGFLEMVIRVPYCKDCHKKVKRLFGDREQEAVSIEIRKWSDIIKNEILRITLAFRNPQYAHMFRQANRQLIVEGKKMAG